MKMTPIKIETILRRYNDLVDSANTFVNEKNNGFGCGTIRFDDNGNIENEINTSCHCHPEYKWVVAATKEEFSGWLTKHGW